MMAWRIEKRMYQMKLKDFLNQPDKRKCPVLPSILVLIYSPTLKTKDNKLIIIVSLYVRKEK